jgi:predicted PurR-regulated permease PerM
VLGVTNPLTWGVVGLISDLIPHLGYGVVTALVLHYLYPFDQPVQSGTQSRDR